MEEESLNTIYFCWLRHKCSFLFHEALLFSCQSTPTSLQCLDGDPCFKDRDKKEEERKRLVGLKSIFESANLKTLSNYDFRLGEAGNKLDTTRNYYIMLFLSYQHIQLDKLR